MSSAALTAREPVGHLLESHFRSGGWPALFAVIGWTIYSKTGSTSAAAAVVGGALVVGAIGFVKPPVMRVIYVG